MSDIVRRSIAVFDGQLVDPFTVTHLDGVFRIETIAHAMCLDNRYGGHTSDIAGNPLALSTAEHCLNVEHITEMRTQWMASSPTMRLMLRRDALTHDAAEAYLRDVLAPIKHSHEMAPYRLVEARLTREMRRWFQLPIAESAFVKDIDVEIRGTEARQLFRVIPPEWEANLAPVIPGIQCGTMSPIEAKTAWLAKFWELFPNFKE
jgi:hypothetical protein